jgi:hypothetical protein
MLSALRVHAKAPYKTDLLWETLRALNRPGRARTGIEARCREVFTFPTLIFFKLYRNELMLQHLRVKTGVQTFRTL